MSARIVELSRVVAARAALHQDDVSLPEPSAQQFQFWAGASGERYVHSVFSLIGCPELPNAVYVLLRTDSYGRRKVLRIGRTEHDAPSLNLAEVRHRGAKLGANEVHVHLLADSQYRRREIETDLRLAHFQELSAENLSCVRH